MGIAQWRPATLGAVSEDRDAPPSGRVLAVAWLLLAGAVLWHGLHPISDLDLWWHMRLGEQMLATQSLVDADPFSFTQAGTAWAWKDIGFALLTHWLWNLGGPAAIVVFKAAAFVGLGALLWRLLRHGRSFPPSLAIVAVALAMDGTAYRFTERAASLSLVILVAVLVLIEGDRQGRRGLYWAIGLTVLNANVHRGVLVVPIVVGAYAVAGFVEARLHRETHASQRWARNIAIAAACGLACLATPFTTALFSTSQNLMGEHTAMLTEWAPVSLELMWALTPSSILLVGLVAIAGLVLAVRVRPLPVWDLLLCAMALTLGLASMRHLPYLALLGIGPIALAVATWVGWTRRVGGLLAIAVSAGVLASAVSKPLAPPSLGLAPAHYPERGVGFVKELEPPLRIEGPMLNEFGYGGYLVFHLWPEYPVYIDGRTDLVYPPEHVQAYVEALADPKAFAREVQRHDLQWVFVDNAPHAGARAFLDADPAWVLVHASRRALIYVRADGPNADLAKAKGYRILWAHDLDGSLARAAQAGYGQAAVAELRRMTEEDPDNLYAVAALARLSARLGIAPP